MSRISHLWFCGRIPGSTLTPTPASMPIPEIRGETLSAVMQASSHLSSFYQTQRATPNAASIIGGAESVNSATYTDLATPGPAVTVPIGVSGLLLVGVYAQIEQGNAVEGLMGFALSGANTQAAADSLALSMDLTPVASSFLTMSAVFVLLDLAPGSTTVTAKYRTGGAAVGFANRRIFAVPL